MKIHRAVAHSERHRLPEVRIETILEVLGWETTKAFMDAAYDNGPRLLAGGRELVIPRDPRVLAPRMGDGAMNAFRGLCERFADHRVTIPKSYTSVGELRHLSIILDYENGMKGAALMKKYGMREIDVLRYLQMIPESEEEA